MTRILRSTIIDAPIDRVWSLLRDFDGHARWHPAIAFSEIEGGRAADEVGCVRRFRLRDGGVLRERLLRLSDREHSFTYGILDAPVPLHRYVATVTLKPVTDGDRTLWTWSSEFFPPPEREAELSRLVGEGIYERGMESVRAILAPHGVGPMSARLAETAPPAAGPIETGAIVVRAHGGPEVLEWRRWTAPPPGPGEIRLRHAAIGVNFIDVYCRTGYFALLSPPAVPGMEGAGTVLDIGPGVQGIRPRDRIAYAGGPLGAYAEVRTMPADLAVVLPPEVSDEIAAAGLLKGLAAEFLLHRVHPLRAGETVLVHAAAGGMGLILCQWARALGATVIGTVSTEEKARAAREAGCAHLIVRGREDVAAAVMRITGGRGDDVAYDAVGRDSFTTSFEALAMHGHLVSYGQASGDIGPVDIARFASKSARISRPNYGHYAGTAVQVRAGSARLFEAMRLGIVRPVIGSRLPLRDAARAHRDLEARTTIGSTILLP
jgi:NADPH2:quinone reductase